MSLNFRGATRSFAGQMPGAASGFLAAMGQAGTEINLNNSLPGIRRSRNRIGSVEIKRIVRRMRGGSQARLVEGQDGRFYVAKFTGNPQGNRTLINEWIVESIMSQLGISTPPLCLLRLPATLRNEELCFEVGNNKIQVEGEWHLGSLSPVNPETKVILDFLPRRLLENVVNLNDFAKVFVVDRWLYQSDRRQAIFVREPGSAENRTRFRAHLIDHGKAFAGSSWELREAAGHGLYFNKSVYSLINMPEICQQTVSQVEALTEEQVLLPLATLADCWLSAGEYEPLNQLMKSLCKSRSGLRRMIERQLASLPLEEWSSNEKNESAGAGAKRKGVGSVGTLDVSACAG
jgi:hypothetical protein